MPRSEHRFIRPLDENLTGHQRLRVRFETQGNDVLWFTLQYETYLNDSWHPVVRYDTSHGEAHRDTYDRSGEQIEKTWLGVREPPFNALLTARYNELQRDWPRYLQAFLKRGRSRS